MHVDGLVRRGGFCGLGHCCRWRQHQCCALERVLVVGVQAVQALPYQILDLAPLVGARVQVLLHRSQCRGGVPRRRQAARAFAIAEKRFQLAQRRQLPGLLLRCNHNAVYITKKPVAGRRVRANSC